MIQFGCRACSELALMETRFGTVLPLLDHPSLDREIHHTAQDKSLHKHSPELDRAAVHRSDNQGDRKEQHLEQNRLLRCAF